MVLVSSKSLANGTATWQQRTGTEWETATGGNPMGNYYYSVTNTVPATYFYRLKYEDMCGTEYSNNEIQVTYLDAVDGGTVTATVAELCVDASATLKHEMETFRDPANTYTWERRRSMTAWENLGSTADTYEVTNTAGNDGEWLYRIKVEGDGTPDFGICNVSYSPAYKIVLHPVPTVTLSSGLAEETVCDGYKVDITLTGTPNTKYFMERSVDGNAEGLREVTEISEILTYVGDGNSPQTVTYKVTPKINDCAGTSVTKTYYLWPSLTLNVDQAASVLTLNCKGAENGAIVLTAQPSAMAYTFTLYNVATGQVVAENTTGNFTGLSAGVYRITASNSVSCSAETTAVITEPETHVTIDNATVTNVLCNGGSDGAIELSISGGVAPYLVSLNGAAYTTNTSYSDLFAGTYVFTVKDANGCVSSTSVTVTANEPSSIELSSAAGTQDQTVCEKTDIDPVQYTLGGSADGYVLTGALPAGVTHGLSGSVITISGNPKPVEYGAYTYTITTTGHAEPCPAATITGTITVNRESTITLSSLSGTRHQTICEGLAITDVQYTLGGSADDYMITGLPNGVTANLVAGVITLSGTPEELGTFNYTLTPSGHTLPCPPAVTNGSIIVNPLPSITSFTLPGRTWPYIFSSICTTGASTIRKVRELLPHWIARSTAWTISMAPRKRWK